MNRKSCVHQMSKIGVIVVQAQARSCAVMSEQRCVVVDQQCRESDGKQKWKGI